MKIEPQGSAEMRHLAEKLAHQRVAMLTLEEVGEGLSSRPMTPLEMDAQGAIWMMTSRAAIQAHVPPSGAPVNLAFVQPGDGNYISVAGVGKLVDDPLRKEALWSVAARPWFDGPKDPDLVLLKVIPLRADIWDSPGNAVTRLFGMTASVLAGREIGLGHKEVIEPPRRP